MQPSEEDLRFTKRIATCLEMVSKHDACPQGLARHIRFAHSITFFFVKRRKKLRRYHYLKLPFRYFNHLKSVKGNSAHIAKGNSKMEANAFFEIKDMKVFLSDEAKALALKELCQKAQEYGLKASRVTLWRAQERGYFHLEYHRPGIFQRRGNVGFVRLSTPEQSQSTSMLMKMFGISPNTARQAKKRGWFEVSTSNEDSLTDLAKGRIVPTPTGRR